MIIKGNQWLISPDHKALCRGGVLNCLQLLKQQFKSERKKQANDPDDYLAEFNGVPHDMPKRLFEKAYSKELPAGNGEHAAGALAPAGPLRINDGPIAGKRRLQPDAFRNRIR